MNRCGSARFGRFRPAARRLLTREAWLLPSSVRPPTTEIRRDITRRIARRPRGEARAPGRLVSGDASRSTPIPRTRRARLGFATSATPPPASCASAPVADFAIDFRTAGRSATPRRSRVFARSRFPLHGRASGSALARTVISRRRDAMPRGANSTAITRASERSARARNTGGCRNSERRCRRSARG